MKFKASVTVISKLHNLSSKMNLKNILNFDTFLDNHPDILAKLQTYTKIKTAITGSCGKKTLLDMFCQILTAAKSTYISNIDKNADKSSFLTSIALDISNKKQNSNYPKEHLLAALDEFELQNYFINTKFDYLLLHNLFTDQKDSCTLNEKRKIIQDAIMLNSKLNLIINADDPMFFEIDAIKNDSAQFKKRKKIYYGFEEIEYAEGKYDFNQKNDMLICPKCLCPLGFRETFYSHLGIYNCECNFKRPKLDISASARIFSDYCILTVNYNENKNVFKVPLGGVHNAYNALGAIALAYVFNIERKVISEAFENYKPLKARDEIINYKEKKIKIKVVENPTSLTQALRETVLENSRIILCIDDDKKDGKDTSWIFNSNAKSLIRLENKIYTTSKRCDDVALWLKYSGINPCLIVIDSNIKNAIECCYWETEQDERMLILTTPSSVDKIYGILNK